MIDDKPKRKNQPTFPRWKHDLRHSVPFLFFCLAGYLTFADFASYTNLNRQDVILPLMVYSHLILFSTIIILIISAFVATYHLRLPALVYVMNVMISLIVIFGLFIGLLMDFQKESKIVDSVYLSDKSYQLVHISDNRYGDDGLVILYGCDSLSIICNQINHWHWHWRWVNFAVSKTEPTSELQHMEDFIFVYVNDESIYKLDIETEQAINR